MTHPSDEVLLDCLGPLWIVRRWEDGADWYGFGTLPTYAQRILAALEDPYTARFTGDPAG